MNKVLVVIVAIFMAVATQAQPVEKIINLFETDSANVQVKTVGEKFTLYYFNDHLVVLEKLGAVSYELYLDRHFAGYIDSTANWDIEQGYYAPATVSNVARIKSGQNPEIISKYILYILKAQPKAIDISAVPEYQDEFAALGVSEFFYYLSLTSIEIELWVPNLITEMWVERIGGNFENLGPAMTQVRWELKRFIEIFGESYKETPQKNELYQQKLEEIASLI